MLRVEDSVLVLLAAGRSERFGDGGSKLDQPLFGRPLGLHAAEALAALPFAARVAVTGRAVLRYEAQGFAAIANPDPARGQASSLGLGVAWARERGAASVLIALADMPCVTAAHVRALFAAAEGAGAVVASSDGRRPMPPALFGADRLVALLALDGDAGARGLIAGGRHVVAAAAELVDVDTPADLEALRRAGAR